MKEVSDELSQVGVVRLLFKPERPDVVVVGRELGWKKKQKQELITVSWPSFPSMTRSDMMIGISVEIDFRLRE